MRPKSAIRYLAAFLALSRSLRPPKASRVTRGLCILAVLLSLASCGNVLNSAIKDLNADVIATVATATPVFSLASDVYTSDQELAITCGTSRAKIYYTTNNTTPTEKSAEYTGPISLLAGNSYTIRAVARATGYVLSSAAKVECIIDSAAPAAPTDLAVNNPDSSSNYTELDLTWTPVSDGSVTFYRVYRDTSSAGSFSTYFDTDASSASFNDTTVQPGTTYYYRVRSAKGSADNPVVSPFSNLASSTSYGVAVTGIALSGPDTYLRYGSDTLTLTSAVTPSNASIQGLTWTSSDGSIATVGSSGVVTRGGEGKGGSVTITGTAMDNSEVTASYTLKVCNARLVFDANMGDGRSGTAVASGIPSVIDTYMVGDTWTWTSPAAGNLPQMLDPYAAGVNLAPTGSSNALFKCWNTAADGSGTNYYIGDTLPLAAGTNTVYAQWLGNSINAADYLLTNALYDHLGSDGNPDGDGWEFRNYFPDFGKSGVYCFRACNHMMTDINPDTWTGYGYSIAFQSTVDLVDDLGLDPALLARSGFALTYELDLIEPVQGGYLALQLQFLDENDNILAESFTTGMPAIPGGLYRYRAGLSYDGSTYPACALTGSSGMAVRKIKVINHGANYVWLSSNYLWATLK